jgi:hypothetical protein
MIVLQGPLGTRKVAEGVPYRLLEGEAVVGSTADEDKIKLETALDEAGVKWGDAIAWVTKRLGVKQCAPCKARQEILNHMGTYGIAETVRLLKETANG